MAGKMSRPSSLTRSARLYTQSHNDQVPRKLPINFYMVGPQISFANRSVKNIFTTHMQHETSDLYKCVTVFYLTVLSNIYSSAD